MARHEDREDDHDGGRRRGPWFGWDVRCGLLGATALGFVGVPRLVVAPASPVQVAQVRPEPVAVVVAAAPVAPPTFAAPPPVVVPTAEPPRVTALPAAATKPSPNTDALTPVLPDGAKQARKGPPGDDAPPAKFEASPAVAKAGDRSPASFVPALEVRPTTGAAKAAAEPVHPYFERYLDRKEYFVRPGDTLANVAERLYGDSKRTGDLLAANRETLPTADALKPGMRLRLP